MYYDDFEGEQKKSSGGTPAWMLTFADLVSLLICFFVLLYSMKSVDESIWKKISGSFAGALNYSQKFKQVSPNNESGVEAEKILNSDGMEYIESILVAKFEKEGLLKYVKFKRDLADNSLHVTIPGQYMFIMDTDEISAEGEAILTFITESVQYINDDLEIASYVAPHAKGLAMQNSMMRSLAVRDYILRKGSKKTIKVIGYGSQVYDSLKDIMTDEELQKNTVKLNFIIRERL